MHTFDTFVSTLPPQEQQELARVAAALLRAASDCGADAPLPPTRAQLVAEQREALRVAVARVADLEAGLLDLRRRVSALEQRASDGQRAQNVLASWTDTVEAHLAALLFDLTHAAQ